MAAVNAEEKAADCGGHAADEGGTTKTEGKAVAAADANEEGTKCGPSAAHEDKKDDGG